MLPSRQPIQFWHNSFSVGVLVRESLSSSLEGTRLSRLREMRLPWAGTGSDSPLPRLPASPWTEECVLMPGGTYTAVQSDLLLSRSPSNFCRTVKYSVPVCTRVPLYCTLPAFCLRKWVVWRCSATVTCCGTQDAVVLCRVERGGLSPMELPCRRKLCSALVWKTWYRSRAHGFLSVVWRCVGDVCVLQQEPVAPLQAIFLTAVLWVFSLFSNLTYWANLTKFFLSANLETADC